MQTKTHAGAFALLRAGLADILKSVFLRFVLGNQNLVNSKITQDIAAVDAYGYECYEHFVLMLVFIPALASVLLVLMRGQYQSLD